MFPPAYEVGSPPVPPPPVALLGGENGNIYIMAFIVFSMFGIFRILAGSYVLKVASITNPFCGSESFLKEKTKIIGLLTSVIFDNSTFKGVLNPETGSLSLGPAKLPPNRTPFFFILPTLGVFFLNTHCSYATLREVMTR